jgi:hypothetical protein
MTIAQRSMERAMLGVTRRETMRNEDIRKIMLLVSFKTFKK